MESITYPEHILWYLHELAAPLIRDEHWSLEARALTLELERAIILCEDHRAAESSLELDLMGAIFLISIVSRAHKDAFGKAIGQEALKPLIRARVAAELGRVPTADCGDITYEEAYHAHDHHAGHNAD